MAREMGIPTTKEALASAAQMTSIFGYDSGAMATRAAQVAQRAEISPTAAMGFMTRLDKTLQTKHLTTTAERVLPDLLAGTASGGTLEEASELAIYLQKMKPDLRGSAAKTAGDVMQRLFKEDIYPVAAGRGGKQVFRSLGQVAPDITTMGGALAYYRKQFAAADPETRNRMLSSSLAGSGALRGVVANLLTGEAGAAATFAGIQRSFAGPSEAGGRAAYEAYIGGPQQLEAVQVALSRGQSKAGIEALKAENVPGAVQRTPKREAEHRDKVERELVKLRERQTGR